MSIERVRKLLALADSTTFPEEADTARKLANVLMVKNNITEAMLKVTKVVDNYYDTAAAWWRYWEFGGGEFWSRGYRNKPRVYHSGDPVNRDFSSYIGRRSANDPEFKVFWNGMSKEERKLWKSTYWKG